MPRCRENSDLLVTHERLRELLHYDPETGIFTRLKTLGAGGIGKPAGCPNNAGYLRIMIDGESYLAHRLAWFYMTGAWPIEEIDHQNSTPLDNRWLNLREASRRDNNVNRRIAKRKLPKGVYAHGARFVAKISHEHKPIHLGVFDTAKAAGEAFARKAAELRGEFCPA